MSQDLGNIFHRHPLTKSSEVVFFDSASGDAGNLYWRKNGSTGAGHIAVRTYDLAEQSQNTFTAVLDGQGKFEAKCQNSTGATSTFYLNGFKLFKGM